MLGLIFCSHLDAGGGYSVFPNFFGRKLPARHLEATQFGAKVIQVATGIHQSAEGHVSTDARKTIKIGEFHGNPPRELPVPMESRRRRIDSIGGGGECQTRGT